ncbi:hypothetical protein G7043_31030 [Lentzea sp. NEAU-D13]|uniref:Uncharacterized protein n=1 Tax=Lentzea alba TaxID=2714351 RepID=A0A7C9RU00_9PSEU|nr:hypothetical protein [Lentzea alba]NGY63365.1 hypothetical protein [Lentzea alba]
MANNLLRSGVTASVLAAAILSLAAAPASAAAYREFKGPIRSGSDTKLAFYDKRGFEESCRQAHGQVASSGIYAVRQTDPDEQEPGHLAGYQARVKCKLRD